MKERAWLRLEIAAPFAHLWAFSPQAAVCSALRALGVSIINASPMICAHCQRCGKRSALGQGASGTLAPPKEEATFSLRCDMCGCRRVRLFEAQGPAEMLAFLTGRM